MARPFKTNETPVAPFNLREKGPLPVTSLERLLGGAAYRVGLHDKAATQDRDPCPQCGARVIWAPTARREGEAFSRYVYARCTANPGHAWGFRSGGSDGEPFGPVVENKTTLDNDLTDIAASLIAIGERLRKLSARQVTLHDLLNMKLQ